MKRIAIASFALLMLSGCASRSMFMKDSSVQIAEIQAKAQVETIKALAEILLKAAATPAPTPEVK